MTRHMKTIGLALAFLLTTGVTALALQDTRIAQVKVIYDNIKLVVNGKPLNLPVEPFYVEEGYLMVPVRALSEALGGTVEWDPGTKTVYINTDSLLTGTVSPVYVEDLPVLRNVGPFFQLKSRPITIAAREFAHGLVVELVAPPPAQRKEEGKPAHYAEAVVELGGRYTWLEGFVGVDDETRNSWGGYQLRIYGDNLLLYQSEIIKPSQYPQRIIINVEQVQQLSFVVYWEDTGRGDYDHLWAALADFVLY